MHIHNLFPIPIGIYYINRPLAEKELSFVKNQETRSNEGNLTSVVNNVLSSTELSDISCFCTSSLADYFKSTVNPKYEVNLRVTQSWLNYTAQGQYHHRHTHPNSFISGVFYVETNPDDRIYFYRSGYQQIKFPPEQWNLYNSESWWFEATTGMLILFPSSLEHMVPNVQGSTTRISLSFNTFPVGTVGEKTQLTGLELGA